MATKAKNVDKLVKTQPDSPPHGKSADDNHSDLDVPADETIDHGDVGVAVDANAGNRGTGIQAEASRPEVGNAIVDDKRVGGVATPVKKGRPKKEEAPGAPKKKKPKKKGLVSASPSLASNPSYYYDIQNFIVTDSRALESFGCVIPTPPSAAHVATQVGRKVQAPPPPPATTPVDDESSEKYSVTDVYTKPGLTKVSPNAIFCPDCGHRMKKHRTTVDEFRDEIVEFRHCYSAE